jgi:hypothetical protein
MRINKVSFVMPALLTKTSIFPAVLIVSSIKRAASPSLDKSAGIQKHCPPAIQLFAASNLQASRPVNTTVAPAAANPATNP